MITQHININNTDFYLELGDKTARFGDEGIHQKVLIYTTIADNINILYKSDWGLETYIASLYSEESMMGKLQYRNNNIYYINGSVDDNVVFNNMNIVDTKKFMKWLLFCDLPITEQRKFKLKKWKEKQSG